MRIVLQWFKANSVMLINASSLIGTTAITSIFGFAYWWVAARKFSPETIGIASASVSVMMLLGSFCIMGLGTLLITELPRQPGQEISLISTALMVVGVVGGCIGMLFALFAPYVSTEFGPLRASTTDVIIFAVGIGFASITLVFDQALIGLLHGGLQLVRNTLFATIKLAVLLVVSFTLSGNTGMTIYATWTIGSMASLAIIVLPAIWKRGGPISKYLPQWGLLRKLGLAALQHHLLNITLQLPTLVLPVLVTTLLSARMNAWFYVSWMIASFVFLVSGALTIVLHAMNSAQQSTLAHKARVTIGLALITGLLANCLLQVTTKQVLGLFGGAYADQATWCLRVLLLAVFPLTIKNHYISICRIHDRIAQAMRAMLPGGLIELTAAIVGAHFGGLIGLSLGWVIAIYIESLFMLRTVYKTLFSTAKSAPLLSQSDSWAEAIWQVDTMQLPVIGQEYLRTHTAWMTEVSLESTGKREGAKIPVYEERSLLRRTNVPQRSRIRLKPPRLQRYVSDEEETRITDKHATSQLLEEVYMHSTMKEIQ